LHTDTNSEHRLNEYLFNDALTTEYVTERSNSVVWWWKINFQRIGKQRTIIPYNSTPS
jgi:hypothetical protein